MKGAWLLLSIFGSIVCALPLEGQSQSSEKKLLWKSVEFAIVKFNDEAPKSWNIYHTERKGLLLVRLWKRYLLVDLKEQDRKSTRLNSSHLGISYAVFCLKKKTNKLFYI